MRLCDTDIERHLDEGKIVIEPRPGVERISGVSVDVLLGKLKALQAAHGDRFAPRPGWDNPALRG